MRASSFLYVSLGILALAVAYHLGATIATAQSPGNPIVAATGYGQANISVAIATNGDAYVALGGGNWAPWGNVFGGSPPTATSQQSWGQVKARYR